MMENNKLQLFENEEFGRLEILMIDGKPYFPATGCAKVLGYANPHDAIKKHCPHLAKREVGVETGKKADGSPAYQLVVRNIIPEGDLYRLIIRSKLPAAVRFEAWVFDDVLPSIRKHGAYISPELLEKLTQDRESLDPLLHALQEEQELADRLAGDLLDEKKRSLHFLEELVDEMEYSDHLEDLVEKYEPKATHYDLIMNGPGTIQVSLIAKDYGMTAAKFNKILHALGIQYKMGNTWLLYQRYAAEGYTRTKTYYVNPFTSVTHTQWTQKGRVFLYDTLKAHGIVPVAEMVEVRR